MNIPATLVRTVNGRKYQMQGTLLSINESNDTCSMRLNGTIKRNIPLNSVLINEGFMDKIKEYGSKVVNYVRTKIKGFFVLIDEVTKQIVPGSQKNMANLAVASANGEFTGVLISPSPDLCRETGISGLSVDEVFAPMENKEIEEANTFWSRVIRRAGTTDDSIQESVQYVYRNYYKPVLPAKSLNERVVYTIDTVPGYGPRLNTTELKQRLRSNIIAQVTAGIGKPTKEPPLLIWGAPGIGKTSIVHAVADDFRNNKKYDYNFHIQTVQCAGLTIENWTLPSDATTDFGENIKIRRFTDTAKAWLPVYEYVPDQEKMQQLDAFFNDCRFLGEGQRSFLAKDGKPLNGGIIFFDEFARTYDNVQKLIFNLAADRTFGDNYIVASRWAFVYAANRAVDEYEADSEDPKYQPNPAGAKRSTPVTFVPTKEEWIKWAQQINQKTGLANIEPFIIDFIKASPEHVWYSTVVNGGYDDLLQNPNTDKLAHESDSGDWKSSVQDVLMQAKLYDTARGTDPRTWEQISNAYRAMLKDLFIVNKQGIPADEYINNLIQKSKITVSRDNSDVPAGFEQDNAMEYYGGIRKDVLIDALNDDISPADWEEWVEDNGGEAKLNPTHARGRYARYNTIMNWFINKAVFAMRDPVGDPMKTKSMFMQQWTAYNEYERTFTDDVIASIWNTNKMPDKELQADDDKVPTGHNFAATQFSKWKANPIICEQVYKKIFYGYPGNMDEQLDEDYQNIGIDNYVGVSDQQIIEDGKKIRKQYTINVNGEIIDDLLIQEYDFKEIEVLKAKLNTLKNSKLARQLCNFALWVAKVTLQTGAGQNANVAQQLCADYFNSDSGNIEAKQKFYNKVAISKLNSKTKNSGDNALKLAKNIELASSPLFLAVMIFSAAKKRENNEATKAAIANAKAKK